MAAKRSKTAISTAELADLFEENQQAIQKMALSPTDSLAYSEAKLGKLMSKIAEKTPRLSMKRVGAALDASKLRNWEGKPVFAGALWKTWGAVMEKLKQKKSGARLSLTQRSVQGALETKGPDADEDAAPEAPPLPDPEKPRLLCILHQTTQARMAVDGKAEILDLMPGDAGKAVVKIRGYEFETEVLNTSLPAQRLSMQSPAGSSTYPMPSARSQKTAASMGSVLKADPYQEVLSMWESAEEGPAAASSDPYQLPEIFRTPDGVKRTALQMGTTQKAKTPVSVGEPAQMVKTPTSCAQPMQKRRRITFKRPDGDASVAVVEKKPATEAKDRNPPAPKTNHFRIMWYKHSETLAPQRAIRFILASGLSEDRHGQGDIHAGGYGVPEED